MSLHKDCYEVSETDFSKEKIAKFMTPEPTKTSEVAKT
jgi:hypothetical protein